ncbi:hypothetical protein LX32DRAFT_667757 [Colletotrichum zoysiae]|uniref:Uncharacterized protein n=1 Tax=Colletotrichum zoysiae TaxID=1216348 RepID=A0AAD9H7N9_9PEZI|nr:hypothetical protein LX32DRAFT_667757 [Colletotrichum zoysiae]
MPDERDLETLVNEFRRSKESVHAGGRRQASRQASRATRASRASIESQGPLSSNEDLDLHVDLPPGILADESAVSSRRRGHPPGKPSRKTKRSSTTRSERKTERSAGVQPAKRRRGRGIRAALRRIFGLDDNPEAAIDAPHGKPKTRAPQKPTKKASPERSPEHTEAEPSSSKEPTPPPGADLPKNDAAA